MSAAISSPRPPTKGERTAQRILDCAETLFAERGFEGTSLRAIAAAAGLHEPGLYNHFASKQALYAAVLDRALAPLADTLDAQLRAGASRRELARLPEVVTDLLLAHPTMAAFFQQALRGDARAADGGLVADWLDRLFDLGLATLETASPATSREDLAIEIIALFNVTTGYVLSQRALASMAGGDVSAPENVERHKRVLRRMAGALRRP